MKYLLFFFVILVASISFAWEWEGLVEKMYYEDAINIIGRPIEVETDASKIGDKKIEMAKARFNKYKEYIVVATFSREHQGEKLYGYTLFEYDITQRFTLSALKIIPIEPDIFISDVHNIFGNPDKIGRNGNLGLSEEYQDGAFVDYSAIDDSTVISISWGYTHSDLR